MKLMSKARWTSEKDFSKDVDRYIKRSTRTIIQTDDEGVPILNDANEPITYTHYTYQPSILHFAFAHGIHRDTLHQYGVKWPDTYKKLRGASELYLATQLSNPKANTVGTIFALKNNFGWKDKVEIESTKTISHQLDGITTEELRAMLTNTANVSENEG